MRRESIETLIRTNVGIRSWWKRKEQNQVNMAVCTLYVTEVMPRAGGGAARAGTN